ncbi:MULTISPECIES: chlorinating enzyme [Moorena]|uniref:BarB1 n=2 Tax=Cyanophyceae TaxID=3028117 RepID=F4XJI7_9CYAN|nr:MULTISPECIES: chlorinating enzyme [Moorena]AAN32975.1 BarB1 [Lyngbya majuscula]NEP53118.1 chlorinating enzyme [Moorena sp. SIO3C2]NEQ17693.1 chlorinating enzyme [Moorena sp. SIO3E2]AEE88292.1 BarB1 [Moorena producens 3L]EGJ35267.1 chlorinating enzyme [Moorena producens 3L]
MKTRAKAELSYYLSVEEKQFFRDNGYIGPFTLFQPEEILELWNEIRMDLLDRETAPFPNSKMNYDRHLDIQALSDIISHPKIAHRVSSLLGSNVLCWRTAWFPKYPGDEGTDWHQAESFVEFEGKSKLVPTESHDGPWELTAWVAFSEATRENGCMKVMPGTHNTWYFDEHRNIEFEPDKINQKLTGGKKTGVYGYDYYKLKLDPNWEPDESQAVHLEMEPGQFILFTSRCMHGSEPNTSGSSIRYGWSTRFVPTDVRVYPDWESFQHFGEVFPLERYATVLVAGEDTYKHNKIRRPLGQ